MIKKRMVALMAAATMLLNVTPVMATGLTQEVATAGSTTVTGSGTVSSYDQTPIYKVTLPTSQALSFVVDPYGLLSVASGSSLTVDQLGTGGKVESASDAVGIIKNESSKAITVDVQLYVTNSGSINLTTTGAADVVATGTALNLFLAMVPSSASSDSLSTFKASSHVIPIHNTSSGSSDVKFKLDAAKYEIVNTNGSYSLNLVSDAANYDGTTFRINGSANKNADWSTVTSDLTLNAVFTIAEAADADVLDTTVTDVYGLVSGSAAQIVKFDAEFGAAAGSYTATFDGTNDVTFMIPANATKLDLIEASGTTFAKGAVAMQPTGFTYNPTTGELVIKASYLKGATTRVKFLVYGIQGDPDKEVTLTVNYK